MRIASQPGLIAGLSLQVAILKQAMPTWRSVLYPLHFCLAGGGSRPSMVLKGSANDNLTNYAGKI